MLKNDLQKIGLTEKEAMVYLASLELGESSVQKIAQKAKVNRATTYVILEQLLAKGVVASVEQGSKRFFVATGPYALKQVIRQQSEEISDKKAKLEKLFPKLKKVHNTLPNRAVVRYYEGKEALQSVRELSLEAKSKQIHTFYSEEAILNVFDEDERKKYHKRRHKNGVKFSGIYNAAAKGGWDPAIKKDDTDVVTVEKDDFHFPCDITIFDDYVSISILTGIPSGILLESESIAQTFRSIFKLAYEAAQTEQVTK
jgi:HTH-type transcriptional regulator, sugar sensing transcriptional regulator